MAWVGKDYKFTLDPKGNFIYSSADKMRAIRMGYKPKEEMIRANFTENTGSPSGRRTEVIV